VRFSALPSTEEDLPEGRAKLWCAYVRINWNRAPMGWFIVLNVTY
jgi:hypothetical protein